MDEKVFEQVYQDCLSNRPIQLTAMQDENFRYACKKAVLENPTLSFPHWVTAANIYLNLILSFPQIELGPIVEP